MAHEPGQCGKRPPGRSRQDLFSWSLLAGLLLTAALAGPFFAGRVYTHDDLGAFHLPVRAFYAERLARGEPFDWTPQLFGGFYLAGEGQAGTYHPMHLLLYRALPLPAAMACELLASYPFMLAGTYLFLLRRLRRPYAAMFGSLLFTFSGFNLLHFVHPNAIAIVAHIPWLLWAIDVLLLDSDRRRRIAAQAGIALLTGSQLLLGYPQYVWFSLVAEAAYCLFLALGPGSRKGVGSLFRPARVPLGRSWSEKDSPPRPRWSDNRWWRLATAKGIGLMLGGIQLLPTLDALGHSARRAAQGAFTDWGSLHPVNLVQLIAPYLFTNRVAGQNTHALGLYAGAVPLALIVWLLVRWQGLTPRLKPLARAAVAFGGLALLLAFGKYGPIYRVQRFLPLVGSFRFPCRYILLFQLSVAVVSAIAFAVLVRQHGRKQKTPWRHFVPLAVLVAVSFLAAMVGLYLRRQPFIAPAYAVLAGPLLIGSAALLVAWAARGARGALVGLVLFAAADLGFYGLSYAAYRHTERFDRYVAGVATPPSAPGERVLANVIRFDEPGLRTGNQMTLAGWHRADGYAGLEPARRLDYRQLSALRVAGVRWVKRGESTDAIEGLSRHDDHWLEVPGPLPRVRLVSSARPTADPAREITRIPIESAALVELPLDLPGGPPGRAALVAERPGKLQVRVDCPARQLLVVSESYHPGWKAEVDGRPQPVLRANGDFLGCVVGAGAHEVVLEFRPQSLRRGRLVSCLGLTLMLVSLAVGWVRPGTKTVEENVA